MFGFYINNPGLALVSIIDLEHGRISHGFPEVVQLFGNTDMVMKMKVLHISDNVERSNVFVPFIMLIQNIFYLINLFYCPHYGGAFIHIHFMRFILSLLLLFSCFSAFTQNKTIVSFNLKTIKKGCLQVTVFP